jgi:Rha family phage regulatory protein
VSEYFWKSHRHVLEAIDKLLEQAGGLPNFRQGYYTRSETGSQQHRMYEIDRDGFTLLAMGFTGAEALKFKLAYIAEFNRDGRIMTTSRDVADYFGKNHHHILRDIDVLVEGGVSNFGLTPWRNLQNGQTYREYIMDRDGFTILAMGFTGSEALKFKLAYIAEFNRMEAELNARPQAPALDLRDPRALHSPFTIKKRVHIAHRYPQLRPPRRHAVVAG